MASVDTRMASRMQWGHPFFAQGEPEEQLQKTFMDMSRSRHLAARVGAFGHARMQNLFFRPLKCFGGLEPRVGRPDASGI